MLYTPSADASSSPTSRHRAHRLREAFQEPERFSFKTRHEGSDGKPTDYGQPTTDYRLFTGLDHAFAYDNISNRISFTENSDLTEYVVAIVILTVKIISFVVVLKDVPKNE